MNAAILAAAGEGTRFGNEGGKQYIDLLGRPLLAYSLESLEKSEFINDIVIVTAAQRVEYCLENVVNKYSFGKVRKVVAGGSSRQESIRIGLKELGEATDKVAIHDGARPLIGKNKINEVIEACDTDTGAILAIPVYDTLKTVDQEGKITGTVDREGIWLAQTPQVFDYKSIMEAHEKAKNSGFIGTDDASLMEWMGRPVKIVEGDRENIKVTTAADLEQVRRSIEEKVY